MTPDGHVVAKRGGRRLRGQVLTARACWTMDSPTEDAIASESTRMWCVAKYLTSPWAMRDALVPCHRDAPCDFGARAKEPEQRSHGGFERARHLGDEHPHLAALGERVGVLPFVQCDVGPYCHSSTGVHYPAPHTTPQQQPR